MQRPRFDHKVAIKRLIHLFWLYFLQYDEGKEGDDRDRSSFETRPPELHNLLSNSLPPSIPDILWASPLSFASSCDTHISG